MDKIYVTKHFKSECNVVKCYYDVVDRQYVYKAVKMFSVVKPNETLIFQPVFEFTMDTLDSVSIDNMQCELCNDQHSRINIECKYTKDGGVAIAIPYTVYKGLSIGKIYKGKLYNGHIEIQFQYELVMDCGN